MRRKYKNIKSPKARTIDLMPAFYEKLPKLRLRFKPVLPSLD
jgi:hypothetical protein